MINLTPTFLSEYHNASRGLPEGIDTKLNIQVMIKAGKKITIAYGDKSFLKNPYFSQNFTNTAEVKNEIIN